MSGYSTPTQQTYLSSDVPAGSKVTLVNDVGKTITSLPLPAGVWDVEGIVAFAQSDAGTTSVRRAGAISSTDNFFFGIGEASQQIAETHTGVVTDHSMPTGSKRVVSTGATVIYLVAAASFSGGALSAYGFMRARKIIQE